MAVNYDNRVNSYSLALVLQDVALEQSVEQMLPRMINHAIKLPFIAWFQIWLIDKGDLCAGCSWKDECRDHSSCLHLAAGGGRFLSESGKEISDYDDPNIRLPMGVGIAGMVVEAGKQTFFEDSDAMAQGVYGTVRVAEQQIHACCATPIIYKGKILGVTIGFSRMGQVNEGGTWSWIFSDHIGSAIANTRAFEEINRLKAQLELHNAYLQEEVVEAKAFGTLIGQSAMLRQMVSQIDLVAPTEASVLILGDTGTGKELVAHEIHNRSPRKNGPLVKVNCASIPKELFESEFFGHVKGAFTGAVKDRAGRFEAAEGGTLLLDEVGEVSLEMQGKLLRVLQEKCYERVGDDHTRSADVRIIAATNRDLKKMVEAGRFREDLFYRLHVFPIKVAPLRERMEDVPLLARHFVDISVKELRCRMPKLTKAGIVALQHYNWPGNVRELRNVIERAVILARGGVLHFDLPSNNSVMQLPYASAPQDSAAKVSLLTDVELRRREYENLKNALEKVGWKIKGPGGAAELLGLKPTTLLSRIKRMGLQRPLR